jgi:hypothetical protein
LALNATCTALASSLTLDELERNAAQIGAELGIRQCCVVAYDGNGQRARVLFGGGPGARQGQSFDPAALVPGGMASWIESGASFVVLPLVYRDRNLGHLLLEMDLRHAYAFGAIAEAMGIGLHYSQQAPDAVGSAP